MSTFQTCYCVVLIEKLVSPTLRSIFGLNIHNLKIGETMGGRARNCFYATIPFLKNVIMILLKINCPWLSARDGDLKQKCCFSESKNHWSSIGLVKSGDICTRYLFRDLLVSGLCSIPWKGAIKSRKKWLLFAKYPSQGQRNIITSNLEKSYCLPIFNNVISVEKNRVWVLETKWLKFSIF